MESNEEYSTAPSTAPEAVDIYTNEPLKNELSTKESQLAKTERAEKVGPCGKNCYWITVSLLAGACMGTGSFIYASNFSKYGVVGVGIIGPGPVLYCGLIRLYLELRFRYKTGSWYK